jgi:hypothetical protein
MISSISKIEALLTGITRTQLNKLPHDQAVRFARALRRIADVADHPPVQPPKTTAGMMEAARAVRSVLNTDDSPGPTPNGRARREQRRGALRAPEIGA